MAIEKFHARFSDGEARIPMNSAGLPFPCAVIMVDGYEIRERELEGVFFECRLDHDGKGVTVSVRKEDEAYLRRFTLHPIFEAVVRHLESTDIVEDIHNDQYDLHVQEWGEEAEKNWHSDSSARIACKTPAF